MVGSANMYLNCGKKKHTLGGTWTFLCPKTRSGGTGGVEPAGPKLGGVGEEGFVRGSKN